MSDQNPDEVTSLNADELDMEDLEDVAGGDCGTHIVCGTYVVKEEVPQQQFEV